MTVKTENPACDFELQAGFFVIGGMIVSTFLTLSWDGGSSPP
jgi:hypothetical protein